MTTTKHSTNIVQSPDQKFTEDFEDMKEGISRFVRTREEGLITPEGSMGVKYDGQVNICSGKNAHFKLSPNGTSENISMQYLVKTNAMKLNAEDYIFNRHKLNSKIYEMTDYKKVLVPEDYAPETESIAGAITMLGTVLVKAWDHNLNRYVMIRRLVNMPLFSPTINSTDVHPGLKITPSTSRIVEMQSAFKESGSTIKDFINDKVNTK